MSNGDEAPGDNNECDEPTRSKLAGDCDHWRLEDDVKREENEDKQSLCWWSANSVFAGGNHSYVCVALEVEINAHPSDDTLSKSDRSFCCETKERKRTHSTGAISYVGINAKGSTHTQIHPVNRGHHVQETKQGAYSHVRETFDLLDPRIFTAQQILVINRQCLLFGLFEVLMVVLRTLLNHVGTLCHAEFRCIQGVEVSVMKANLVEDPIPPSGPRPCSYSKASSASELLGNSKSIPHGVGGEELEPSRVSLD